MTRTFRSGEPVWIELATTHPEAAERFYSELLGWTVRQERLAQGTYRMCSMDGRDVAGISDADTLHHGSSHGWITYFAVDDAIAASELAVELGGQVLMPPRYLPSAGTGATIIDPYGAVFGLYQGEARIGVELLNVASSLCWNELDTGEPEQSIAYYRALFGFEAENLDSSTNRPYAVLSLQDEPVAGVLALDSEWPNPMPSRWITYLGVSSLNEALDKVVALGGTPTVGPFDSPHGPLHLVRDSGGNPLCLVQLETSLRSGTDPDDPENPAVTA
ncbi:MAG: VOC family protein [Nocardioidaceae bacterium]